MEDEPMKKVQQLCKKFWKRIYLIAPAMIILFFIMGYAREYGHSMQLKDQILNHPELKPHQSNEIWMIVYNNFDEGTVRLFATESGMTWAMVYPAVILFVAFLLTMLTSEQEAKRNIGIVFVILTCILLLGWWWFVAHFTITF